ncbi:MAG: cytochrome b/b6 domain-containing protein [Actinomycetaceae bacterium]|nr:cytochrome b/b6 domain-containing protein [Actinomycetaceae bacterium]
MSTQTDITNPAITEADAKEVRVLRHKKATRRRHALMLVVTFCLLISGFMMWAGLSKMSGTVAVIHGVIGLIFIAVPLFWVLTDFRNFAGFIGNMTHYDSSDASWLARGGGYLGGADKVAPQGKYNAGQKIITILLIIAAIGLGITGPLMWLGTKDGFFGLFSLHVAPGLTTILWNLHLIFAIAVLIFVITHMFIALLPSNVKVVNSMFGDGTVELDFAQSHYGKWVEDLDVIEEK